MNDAAMLSDGLAENKKRNLVEIVRQLTEQGPGGGGSLHSREQAEQLLQRVHTLFDEHVVRMQTAKERRRSILYQGCSILYGPNGEVDVSGGP